MRAALYCRISSDRADERLGVERQERDLRGICAERGWDVIEPPYVDNDLSASEPRKVRPEYKRLLEDIKRGVVDAVATWDLDRLTRRPTELEEFVAVCDQAGVTQLAFVGGNVDMGTGDGLLVARIKGAVAAEEVRKTRQRIKRKHQELAERGLSHGGGTRPFGFEDDRVTIREPEAVLIREAASRVLAGETLYAIRKDWIERGVRSVTDKPWSVTGIKAFVTRPRTVGLRQHQGQVIGEASWPAILDRQTWDQVCSVLQDPSRRQPAPSRQYPLRGILTCGECDRSLTAMPRAGRRLYGCRKESGGCGHIFVTSDMVESYIKGRLLPLVDSPTMRQAVTEGTEDQAAAARQLVLENAADEKMLRQLEDDYADRAITRPVFLRQSQRVTSRIEGRLARIAALRGHSALDRLGGQVAQQWESMTTDEQRAVFLTLVTKIRVKPATHYGSKQFDPKRLRFVWRFAALAQAAAGLWDAMTDEEKDQELETANASLTDEERYGQALPA